MKFNYYFQAELFAQYVLKIEGDDVSAVEVAYALNDLEETIKLRKEDRFLSPSAAREREKIVNQHCSLDEINSICDDFFGISLCCY